jgi:hypothetical protein
MRAMNPEASDSEALRPQNVEFDAGTEQDIEHQFKVLDYVNARLADLEAQSQVSDLDPASAADLRDDIEAWTGIQRVLNGQQGDSGKNYQEVIGRLDNSRQLLDQNTQRDANEESKYRALSELVSIESDRNALQAGLDRSRTSPAVEEVRRQQGIAELGLKAERAADARAKIARIGGADHEDDLPAAA